MRCALISRAFGSWLQNVAKLQKGECHVMPYPNPADLEAMKKEYGEDTLLERLVGPFVFRRETHELAGEYLSDYTVVRLRVELSDEERAAYEREREVFRTFLKGKGIGLGSLRGWQMFVAASAPLTLRQE